jgi:hypothetical protein
MSNNEKLIENLKTIAKEALVHLEAYNYMANFWTNYYIYLGILTTVIASVASAASLSKLQVDNQVAGLLTALVALLSAITTFINPSDKSANHKKAKEKFISINMKARRVAIDSLSDDSAEQALQLKKAIGELSDKMTEALQSSPQVAEWVRIIAEKRAESRFKF